MVNISHLEKIRNMMNLLLYNRREVGESGISKSKIAEKLLPHGGKKG